ncbi:MAG: polysaccharide biosynthesis protein [Bacilli bacterium]|nr:polysaccharide biosynthesis protein [Bacilli bacterium]
MRSKNAFYNITSNILLQLITIIYGFIVPKIIISSFGSNVNGLISSITQFLAYITLLESGFGPVVRASLYKPIASKNNKTIANILKTSEKFFRKIAYIFLAYIFILSILYPLLVSKNFDYLYTISLIIIIAISTFAEYFFGMTYRLFLQAKQKNYVISIIQIGTYLLSIIVIIILTRLEANIQIIKLISGIVFIFRPLLQNLYVKKKFDINLKNADNNYQLKNKWDGLAQHIASVIHSNTDITVLTFFCSLNEVSVYSVYYLVIKGIKSLIQAFTNGIDSSFGDMIAKEEYENLNEKFNLYEIGYFTLCTIVFICTMILIVPFISVYTKGITDTNYIRPLFGYLIVISEYIWAVRLPYSSITLAAGHFKETRRGAWIEAIVNIIISIFLVKIYGIVGVAIGTIIAMLIRTIEFIYHSNKYILKRKIFISVKKVILIAIETLICVFISRKINIVWEINYFNWFINALIIFAINSVIILAINIIVYKNEFKKIFIIIMKILRRKIHK